VLPPGGALKCDDEWMTGYRLHRALGGNEHPAEWGEWATWWVIGPDETPVGFVSEHRDLIKHNTWGSPTYVASYNPIDESGTGTPVWREDGFASPQEALAALIAHIEDALGSC
jgi:hypothetical protein